VIAAARSRRDHGPVSDPTPEGPPPLAAFGLDDTASGAAGAAPARGAGGAAPASGPSRGPRRRIGDYVLLGQIARGGMGVVYRARHPRLEREVALKVLEAGQHASPRQLERFRLEGLAAARLRHPHLVAVHDVGRDGDVVYLVMDLIAGETLAERIAKGGPLPPGEAVELVADLARAVDYAHGQGVLHRDVKPANVLLGADGAPLLADFGLAKVAGADGRLTETGQLLGTPEYMSPEQARGEGAYVDGGPTSTASGRPSTPPSPGARPTPARPSASSWPPAAAARRPRPRATARASTATSTRSP